MIKFLPVPNSMQIFFVLLPISKRPCFVGCGQRFHSSVCPLMLL